MSEPDREPTPTMLDDPYQDALPAWGAPLLTFVIVLASALTLYWYVATQYLP